MSKSKSASKPQRRPRGEIDRNYFFGDVLIKTGVAVAVALGAIALYTPFTLREAIDDGMYDYVTAELPALVEANLPVDPERRGIFGHSMGGHGALICALKNAGRYRSLSAFAPISAPMRAPWGEKAFTGYLGPDRATWRAWDATELAAGSGWRSEVSDSMSSLIGSGVSGPRSLRRMFTVSLLARMKTPSASNSTVPVPTTDPSSGGVAPGVKAPVLVSSAL